MNDLLCTPCNDGIHVLCEDDGLDGCACPCLVAIGVGVREL